MMQILIAIALKSLIVSGIALALLALMKNRSAAERSCVAHVGLVALVLLAFGPLVLPRLAVEAPLLLGEVAPAAMPAPSVVANTPAVSDGVTAAATPVPSAASFNPVIVATATYALPAAILLFITLLALIRLLALRARADVLVDGHWLSALARAQRRMGFKHGTALLTSDELSSPISWGLMRPVILLNTRAVEASGEAEAIIAHELAHVARLDWVKLLLARVATALFWFNPLVWILAREAHQLREEAADDSVLAADIPNTDYAQLLVGVARHECPSLLIGAHGVAPSKSSLARRVRRVLDAGSARGPVARSFALGMLTGAVLISAPLAALTLTPKGAATSGKQPKSALVASDPSYYAGADAPADLPHIIADGVAASVSGAVAAVNGQAWTEEDARDLEKDIEKAQEAGWGSHGPRPGTVGPQGAVGPRGKVGPAVALDRAIAMKATGVTPEYVAAMRAAAPQLGRVDEDDLVGMKAVGVTPEYARAMAAAGFGNLSADDLTGARATGVSPDYVRSLAAVGVRGDIDDYVGMRAVGVTPEFVVKLRKSGYATRDPGELIELRASGLAGLGRVHGVPSTAPPETPEPPDPPEDDGDG